MMELHMGQLLERVIRKKGLNISELAKTVGVNRRSMYNWFAEADLKAGILDKISVAIDHDFNKEIHSSVRRAEILANQNSARDDEYWKDKYIDLLERYSELLGKQHD
jgi:DNA-binding XRE family transcriptional regulator